MDTEKLKKEIATIIKNTLNAGTDKGSSQGIIDTKDIPKSAENVVKFLVDNSINLS